MGRDEIEFVNAIKEKFATKEDLEMLRQSLNGNVSMEKEKQTLEFIEHIRQCKDDHCGIHAEKNKILDDGIIMGILMSDLI